MDLFNLESGLVWGTLSRCLGLVFSWVFIQNLIQVKAISSEFGFSPVSHHLNLIRRDFGLLKGYFYFPSLLWISTRLRFQQTLLLLGALAGLAIFIGLPGTPFYFLACYLIFLSFDLALGFSFPWDSLLFEAGLLGIFLPQLALLPDWSSQAEIHPYIAFLYRFLLFRLLFGFGKYKFSKPNFKDSGYFKNFLINVPLPSPLATWASKLPSWVFRAMYAFAFTAEMIMPIVLFIPGPTRVIAACFIIMLMFGIQLLSNFGFFNLLTAVLAIALFDTQSLLWTSLAWPTDILEFGMLSVLLFYVVFGLFSLPFNTWCSFTWFHWPTAIWLKGHWLRLPVASMRELSRWRLIHAYGVFPVKSQPPMKLVPIIEGSMDGENWETYEFKYTLSKEHHRWKFVAPYHPRLDHFVFYDAFAINNTNFNWSTVGSSIPTDYAKRGGLDCIIYSLFKHSTSVHGLFREIPFKEKPPKWIRVGLTYAIPNPENNQQHLYLADVHRLPSQIVSKFDLDRDVPPELYHWDAHFWRMRSKKAVRWKALSKAESVAEVCFELRKDLGLTEIPDLPALSSQYGFAKANWSEWMEKLIQFEKDYSPEVRRDLFRFWNSLRIVIGLRLTDSLLAKDKHGLGTDYFAFGMLLNTYLSEGMEGLESLWVSSESWYERSFDYDAMNGFYAEAFFKPESFIDHYRKAIWSNQVTDEDVPEVLPGFQKLAKRFGELPIACSLNAWPSMDYNPTNGEWSLGNPVPPDHHFPELYQAFQHKTPSPIPY
ncbi:MAG: hypothetical protein EP332_10160 [Bacteroidetes bacterium]|nr:MAG: hypothetical protein EP332_10160 [Bacteroidota bacterium]